MHYAVIAAGEGSRLVEEGIATPKPLVRLQGQPMVGRLLDIFVRRHAESISIIVNEQMTEVQQYLHRWQEEHLGIPLQILVQSTPSSMHSLAALCRVLPEGAFICTTVDTIFQEDEFADYVQSFEATLAQDPNAFRFVVTPFVEDEKPLWVDTDASRRITAFLDQGPASYVSGGIYGMVKSQVVPVLERCLATGQSRMRNFQRALLDAGIDIRAHVLAKVMDIDHASDILEASRFLEASRIRGNSHSEELPRHRGLQGGRPLLDNVERITLIYRAEEYSPRDNVQKDAAILEAVGKRLEEQGTKVTYLHEEELPAHEAELQQSACIISMARRRKSLLLLQKLEQRGIRVLNRPSAVQVTVQSRSTTLELLQSVGLPVAPFWSYEPSEDEMFQCEPELQQLLPGWVKAMHPRGVTEGDVQRVDTPLEADTRVLELAAQGYTDIIVTRHLEGPLLKLYVVGDHCWPESPHSALALQVGSTLGLSIYGVDLILTAEGPRIIDVNDFPSFTNYREGASLEISKNLQKILKL